MVKSVTPWDPPFASITVWSPDEGACGMENMALDETMLRTATAPTLRCYRWSRPEVTFGYPQRWAEAEAFAAGRPLTRRCTGGGLVEHGADLTVALVVPATYAFAQSGPQKIYAGIHEALRRALGPESLRLASAEEATTGAACFAHPAAGDLLDGSRKIAGGALRRSREGVLYQGSITVAVEPDAVAQALSRQVIPASEPTGWRTIFAELVRSRYGTSGWNQRR